MSKYEARRHLLFAADHIDQWHAPLLAELDHHLPDLRRCSSMHEPGRTICYSRLQNPNDLHTHGSCEWCDKTAMCCGRDVADTRVGE